LSERIKLKYKTKNNVFKVKRDEKKEEHEHIHHFKMRMHCIIKNTENKKNKKTKIKT